jgi:WD40 repeat protein
LQTGIEEFQNCSKAQSRSDWWFTLTAVAQVERQLKGIMYFAVPDPITFEIKLYDSENFQNVVGSLEGHTSTVHCLAFAAHMPRLASADNRAIKVWDTDAMSEIVNLRIAGTPFHMSFDESGTQLLSTYVDQMLMISKWDLKERSRKLVIEVASMSENAEAYFVADDNKIMSFQSEALVFWHVTSGVQLATIELGIQICGIAKSPDDVTAAVAMDDGKVVLVDLNTGQAVRFLLGHIETALCVCFSGDGLLVAAGSQDGNVIVWVAATGSIVSRFYFTDVVYDVSMSYDGSKISCFQEGCVFVYDLLAKTNVLELRGVDCRGQFSTAGVILM